MKLFPDDDFKDGANMLIIESKSIIQIYIFKEREIFSRNIFDNSGLIKVDILSNLFEM